MEQPGGERIPGSITGVKRPLPEDFSFVPARGPGSFQPSPAEACPTNGFRSAPSSAGGNWLVTESVELIPSMATGYLAPQQQETIRRQVVERLAARDPMLRHVMEVKIVCNQRRNFINISVRKDYVTLCYQEHHEGIYYCFFLSDKIEPFVTITAVHPDDGKLHRLTRSQVVALARTIDNFKAKFGISGESYHYTGLRERQETDEFVDSGGTQRGNKAHSSHFHLKLRVSTKMTPDRLPVYQLFDLGALREAVEPVRYNFSRTTLPWNEVYPLLMQDAV
eukprot:TRINITY_DN1625_c1_g2_i1.p2 TRINITY_DN1625_c1_g2~~TRINITY_DN1625_c1_g2_i1.p2  ORF type:complete len:279 (-),score=107.82 TRINITY_DN1625_c1_g2_i1:133-969(-)